MATYANYTDTNSDNIAFLNPSFCLGWVVYVTDINKGTTLEVLYALHRDGRVMESEPLPLYQPNFNKKGRVWNAVDSVPDEAEFNGNYLADMF